MRRAYRIRAVIAAFSGAALYSAPGRAQNRTKRSAGRIVRAPPLIPANRALCCVGREHRTAITTCMRVVAYYVQSESEAAHAGEAAAADRTGLPHSYQEHHYLAPLPGLVRLLPEGALPDDSELVPLREAIQRVATCLNRLDWRKYARVTDDFVVFSADGSHSFCDDYGEMVASVPSRKLDRLRSRSLLGTDPWWELS
jgi:hypothetical protein